MPRKPKQKIELVNNSCAIRKDEPQFRTKIGSIIAARHKSIGDMRHFTKLLCCDYEVQVKKGDEWFCLPLC